MYQLERHVTEEKEEDWEGLNQDPLKFDEVYIIKAHSAGFNGGDVAKITINDCPINV